MRGGVFGTRNKAAGNGKKKRAAAPPGPPRKLTRRAIEREVWREAGAIDLLKKIRNTPTNLERSLTAAGLSARIAAVLTANEQQLLEADLSSIGIPGGSDGGHPTGAAYRQMVAGQRLQLRRHELQLARARRLGVSGAAPGGRYGDNGSVADIFLSPSVSRQPGPSGARW
jgi:hypothetical protein